MFNFFKKKRCPIMAGIADIRQDITHISRTMQAISAQQKDIDVELAQVHKNTAALSIQSKEQSNKLNELREIQTQSSNELKEIQTQSSNELKEMKWQIDNISGRLDAKESTKQMEDLYEEVVNNLMQGENKQFAVHQLLIGSLTKSITQVSLMETCHTLSNQKHTFFKTTVSKVCMTEVDRAKVVEIAGLSFICIFDASPVIKYHSSLVALGGEALKEKLLTVLKEVKQYFKPYAKFAGCKESEVGFVLYPVMPNHLPILWGDVVKANNEFLVFGYDDVLKSETPLSMSIANTVFCPWTNNLIVQQHIFLAEYKSGVEHEITLGSVVYMPDFIHIAIATLETFASSTAHVGIESCSNFIKDAQEIQKNIPKKNLKKKKCRK